ncbi:peptide chain release factor N(5)-glutamine methyltransferase [Legionella micdadei]|uniref:Release factor glutamine methyltransferase n=1 Tax=Legionella micdadei TaxID=451 RepID=A0A098GIE5_LEGMI|nr:peptide chain release factor N(5)-glutamine methyltransferase [Legionella micdadei]ARG96847.1 protein-(glutamine-N5) methyltransferase, release factor-specific [Legionella micdadei]ARG99580.1 protein-(glutamine-N5) methyltransferase, release factor-specific [Legionella micdadei]KTD26527.1 protein methyltransferase HemK [Legionella micdadei]NSL17883.1 peptide chain release factor N(5)-glutamine methyltransferase [Legionella micdadei]CEG61755.1 Protein methyltransferase hemK homolog [Legionel
MIDIKGALSQATTQLEAESDSPRLDGEILLAHVLMKTRTYLYTHMDKTLTKAQWQTFQQLVDKRAHGMPIPYLTGTREFWSLPLKVCEDTLIPRPETELLVELTLKLLADKPHAQILDLGTGSGAIALACAHERPDWQIIACDCSLSALQIAEENAARLRVTNICFYHSDWFEKISLTQKFDAIVTNPPYIAANDPHLIQGDVRFEPTLALVGGTDGLEAIRHIIQHSLARLKPDGLLLIEHGFDQKSAVGSMLNDYGYRQVQCWQDLQGNDRVSGGKR